MTTHLHTAAALLGRKGGAARSAAKTEHCRRIAKLPRKPRCSKCEGKARRCEQCRSH